MNINILISIASWDGKIKIWDVRKGSYDAALLSFDWHQDHTAKVYIYVYT